MPANTTLTMTLGTPTNATLGATTSDTLAATVQYVSGTTVLFQGTAPVVAVPITAKATADSKCRGSTSPDMTVTSTCREAWG